MSFDKPWGNYLLETIVETTAPDAISFWPQTIAWQLIFVLLILFIIKKTHQTWKNYQANAYRREALVWLAHCSLTNEDDIRQLPTLVRKTALLANEYLSKESNQAFAQRRKQAITELRGQHWVAWLDQHCDKTHFSDKAMGSSAISCEKLLSQLAYVPIIEFNNTAFNNGLGKLCLQIELWIKFHDLTATTAITTEIITTESSTTGVST